MNGEVIAHCSPHGDNEVGRLEEEAIAIAASHTNPQLDPPRNC